MKKKVLTACKAITLSVVFTIFQWIIFIPTNAISIVNAISPSVNIGEQSKTPATNESLAPKNAIITDKKEKASTAKLIAALTPCIGIPHSRSKCNKSRSDLKRCFVAQAFPGPVVNQ